MNNSSSEITVEDNDIIAAFRQLNLQTMEKVGYDAYSKALPMIATSAGNILAGEGFSIDTIGKSGRTPRQGFTTLAYADGTGGSVTAFGEYKLKWFVAGTQERWQDQKHGKQISGQAHRYLGAIPATYALERGYDAVEPEFFQTLEDQITESINRIMEQ